MGTGLVIGLAAAVTLLALACLLLGMVLVGARRGGRRLSDELSGLRDRLEQLEETAQEVPSSHEVAVPTPRRDDTEYVITTAGMPALKQSDPAPPSPPIDARQFASVAIGESLIRIASLAYGVRRALSAENRNRIGFEVRREIRRSRRQRKRELKEARRHLRATRQEDAA